MAVTFNDTSTPVNQIASWAWDFGDGSSVDATLQNPVHSYETAGLYTVHLTVTDGSAASDTMTVTNAVTVDPSTFEINLANVPVSLTLNPGETTTNTDARFTVNSTTDWQVTARDTDSTTNGYMTGYSASGSQYIIPATRFNQPFRVLDSTGSYVTLPSGADAPAILKSGTPAESGTAYPLGIRQDVGITDPVLPGTDAYRIVITLTAGSV
jgi:PKD repeat protein